MKEFFLAAVLKKMSVDCGGEMGSAVADSRYRHAGLFAAVNLTAVFCHVIHRPSTMVGGESTRIAEAKPAPTIL